MWGEEVINKKTDYETYTFLLDFTNDGVINAKDYAELSKFKSKVNCDIWKSN